MTMPPMVNKCFLSVPVMSLEELAIQFPGLSGASDLVTRLISSFLMNFPFLRSKLSIVLFFDNLLMMAASFFLASSSSYATALGAR